LYHQKQINHFKMELQNIKALLPDGSYERIAGEVGIASGTVSHFFAGRARVAQQTKDAIKKSALAILKEQAAKIQLEIKAHAVAA